MKKIVLFASGSGTNAENIIKYFKSASVAEVVAVFSNNPQAKVLERAQQHEVPALVFSREALQDGTVLEQLHQFHPDLIVLAGFLWMFPKQIIAEYSTINIHPALLPKYGGKGMYGMKVHQAVLDNKETETGITIHQVNEHYDEGDIVFQKAVAINDCFTAEAIAEKVHQLEYLHFPKVIESILKY